MDAKKLATIFIDEMNVPHYPGEVETHHDFFKGGGYSAYPSALPSFVSSYDPQSYVLSAVAAWARCPYCGIRNHLDESSANYGQCRACGGNLDARVL